MAAIWKNIQFTWKKEKIDVKPTLDFINKIEQKQGSSLSSLLNRIRANDLPIAVSCHVIGTTLREGGVSITDEEIYEMTLDLGTQLGTLVGTIVAGCLPMPKGAPKGKSKAPQKS